MENGACRVHCMIFPVVRTNIGNTISFIDFVEVDHRAYAILFLWPPQEQTTFPLKLLQNVVDLCVH